MLKIHAVSAFEDNYIWLMQSAHGADTLIVDPGDAEPVLDALQSSSLQACGILITHHHADHTGGISQIKKIYPDIPVFGPKQESIPDVEQRMSAQTSVVLHPAFPAFRILDTPGHTAGHISYLIEGNLFCGDTLFAGGCGRLLGGTAEQLYASLMQLRQLPVDTQIYCAHEYTIRNLQFAHHIEPDNQSVSWRLNHCQQLRSNGEITLPALLADELETNPFLRCDQPELISSLGRRVELDSPQPFAVFKTLRSMKDNF